MISGGLKSKNVYKQQEEITSISLQILCKWLSLLVLVNYVIFLFAMWLLCIEMGTFCFMEYILAHINIWKKRSLWSIQPQYFELLSFQLFQKV